MYYPEQYTQDNALKGLYNMYIITNHYFTSISFIAIILKPLIYSYAMAATVNSSGSENSA